MLIVGRSEVLGAVEAVAADLSSEDAARALPALGPALLAALAAPDADAADAACIGLQRGF